MKNWFILFILIFVSTKSIAHTNHYKGIKKIEMDVLRNDEIIGYSNYFFEQNEKGMIVKTYTNFKVELLGITIFSILSEAEEKYENDKLIFFKSNSFQNDKEKYVNLTYNESLGKFMIDGSSFKGKANEDCVIGNWWNHKILKAKKQISPLSGSIKEQKVTFVGDDNILIKKKNTKLNITI